MKTLKFSVLFLAVLSLVLFSGCNKAGDNASTTSDSPAAPAPAAENGATASGDQLPKLTFESADENGEVSHDFGTIKQKEVVTKVFKFTNTGKADLKITDIKVSCGCTTPSYTKEAVAPGATGEVTVQFDSEGKCGAQNKTVTVLANTEPRATVIKFAANIIDCKN
jgi:uncharacterized cupredoxin-like copper-binding protein